MVEKPLARSVEEGQELVELAANKQRVLMCDHTFCYTSVVRKIKEIIQSGELGNILYYDSIRINLGLFQHDVNVIWDLAVHDLAIVDFLLDQQPLQVSAHGVAHAGKMENIAYVALRYPDSMIAHFHVNWLSPVKIRKTLIGGSRKMIEWNDLVPAERIKIYDKGIELKDQPREQRNKFMISYRTGDIHSPYVDSTEALAQVVLEFASSIEEGRTPLTDGHAGLRVLKILEATDRSVKANGANIFLGQ
jgi:predicted dehydrogenase